MYVTCMCVCVSPCAAREETRVFGMRRAAMHYYAPSERTPRPRGGFLTLKGSVRAAASGVQFVLDIDKI